MNELEQIIHLLKNLYAKAELTHKEDIALNNAISFLVKLNGFITTMHALGKDYHYNTTWQPHSTCEPEVKK